MSGETAADRPARGRWWWCAVAAALAAGTVAAGGPHDAIIEWRPGVAWSEPWRWWSAAWVHLSGRHRTANLAAAALVALLGWVAMVGRREAVAWLVAWPATHLALLLEPGLHRYGGLSGVLHAGVAIVAIHLVRTERGSRRALGATLLAGLAVKVVLEAPWSAALRTSPALDIATAPAAHLSGAVCGTIAAWALGRRGRPSGRAAQPADLPDAPRD